MNAASRATGALRAFAGSRAGVADSESGFAASEHRHSSWNRHGSVGSRNIANAKVTLTNEGTRAVMTQESGSGGEYVFPLYLRPHIRCGSRPRGSRRSLSRILSFRRDSRRD